MATLNPFAASKRIVLKIGSALLVDTASGTLRTDWLTALSSDIARLKQTGLEIVIVSSGAIALGRVRLGLMGRNLTLGEKQACAAAGQSQLTQAYEKALAVHNIVTAQALFTLTDTEDRRRWLNARQALNTLISLGAVPIINENDTVATDEIRYGDNDRLAARTAQMLSADTLILLSDIDGLYTADPRSNPSATHIPRIESLTADIMAMGGAPNATANVGTGGMVTKLAAARIATEAGCHMCIVDGTAPAPLKRIQNGAACSWFKASPNPIDARRQWIKGSLNKNGALIIDEGAANALFEGNSLLAAGVVSIAGYFQKGDAVKIETTQGRLIAKGLTAYDSIDAALIIGAKSHNIDTILGYTNGAAIVHRDNMVMEKR